MWTEEDRAVMGDVYRLLQRNADPEDTEAYWNSLIEQGNEIMKRYEGSLLCENMVCAVWLHYEEVLKRQKGNNDVQV